MSATGAAEQKHEILIIRRGGHDDHDDHHGGAWKIAFADFMTAMMCFFLVMWLINAANEQTKAAVASYFNPIKLTDRNASRKGLDDVGEGPVEIDDPADELTESKKAGPAQSAEQKQSKPDSAEAQKPTDEHLFTNPYAVLAEIAAETGTLQNISAKGDGGAQDAGPATGAAGGESYRDPFAPDFWSQEMRPSPQMSDGAPSGEAKETTSAEPAPKTEVAKAEDAKPAAQAEAAKPPAEQVEAKPEPSKPSAATERQAEEIRQEITKALANDTKLMEGVTVEAGKDGVIISITDQLDFGMFEIGSAVPRRDMVLAMEKIGRILAAKTGNIHLNGHTDARPYTGQSYDNWRLSTARAHSAYYMLVRGGLEEMRVTEIAGFADREPKVASDPLAAANRRIEILLEVGG